MPPIVPRVLLHRMPRGDVADLVAEHAGQLRLVVEKRQDAARDVDESARQRERVDRRLIDDGELPRKVRPLRQLRETQPDVADVLCELGIVVDAHLLLTWASDSRPTAISCASLISVNSRCPVAGLVAHAASTDAEQQESRPHGGR